ncbi:LAME_0F01398g1_1 [Lachancea meyersii CBS 8951]|uniref:LAME_0F01398g1_1 n=1 Tax=Lachancea meyersii CBS 8951 TaxID=1266667 RepID=A0A1G4JQ78_9SACH|nr:LAME_0F01398g1_1 [Lachancea meyersii CBS 8951]
MNDLQQAVHLIESLYLPQPPSNVNEIQQQLQAVQRSDHGLELGNQLLSQEMGSPNIEYFGALTLAVQFHTTNSTEILAELLKLNMLHLSQRARLHITNGRQNGSPMLVIKKLMSNAAQIFFRVNSADALNGPHAVLEWNNPLETFCTLVSHPALSPDSANEVFAHVLSEKISYDHLISLINSSPDFNALALLFSEVIMEDLKKHQSSKVGISRLHGVVHDHLYISSTSIINYNLQQIALAFHNNPRERAPFADSVFQCAIAWVNYTIMARSKSQGHMDLSEMFEILIQLMCLHDSANHFPFSENVIAILGEVFANDPTMLSYELRSNVEGIFLGVHKSSDNGADSHQWMLQYMNHLVVDEMYEELKELALCVVDFLQISNLDVCNKLFTTVSNGNAGNLDQYIKVLLQMTNFTLTPVLEEFFSVRMVDFWLDLCDGYNNLVRDTFKPETPELAAHLFGQVVQIYLPKIQLSIKQKIVQEGEDETLLHEFDDFRNAVLDLMESMWAVLGNEKLTNILISSIGQLTPSSGDDLFQIEAMCFCLDKLLTDMTLSGSPVVCGTLEANQGFLTNVLLLIQTGCQQKGASNGKEAQILSCDFVKTGSSMLATAADFIKSDSHRLRSCMDVLFGSLETCANADAADSKIELSLTRCTTKMCETSRAELASYLPTFLTIQKAMMHRSSKVSAYTKQKFTCCVGYLIQDCLRDGPARQAEYLSRVIGTIRNEILECISDRDHVLCLLHCVSELGGALAVPTEGADDQYAAQLVQSNEYWVADPPQLRATTLDLLERVLAQYASDSEFVERACLIMGSQLAATEEGPHFLGYSMQELLDFLLKRNGACEPAVALPYLSYLLELVVRRYASSLAPSDLDYLFGEFFLGSHRAAVASDPDLTQLMINFVSSVLETRPGLIVHGERWPTFILPEFVHALGVKERFTIAAVTKFWTKVVNNKRFSRADEVAVRAQVCELGPQLVAHTLQALLHAQRSDLACYSDFLRALVARYPLQSRQWLEQALPELAAHQLRAHQVLMEKLFVTRGSRAATNAVLEWWLACNGLPPLAGATAA